MRGRELIAYDGTAFQIEWYFTKNAEIPALDYYNKLDNSERRGLLKLLKRMGDEGKMFFVKGKKLL
jgi:hypothetical protein